MAGGRIAAAQGTPVLWDRDATVEQVAGSTAEAAREGAALVAFPEAFGPGYPDWVWRTPPWSDGDRYRRWVQQCPDVIYGGDDDWMSRGNTLIVDPHGRIVAGPISETTGILYADVDTDVVLQARRHFDVVGHYSRPDVFSFSVKRGT